MTRWLQAALAGSASSDTTDRTDRTDKTDRTDGTSAEWRPEGAENTPKAGSVSFVSSACRGPAGRDPERSDPSALFALLRDRGPLSYGAAASVLGWGATRAWRAEAALKAAGRIEHDRFGRAAIPSPENDL